MDKILVKELTDLWGLGRVLSFEKAKKGVVNSNWIVKTTKGKYVFRGLGKNKKLKELKFELEYLDYIKNKIFPYKIPAPIKNLKGKFFAKKGNTIFWVYKFIEGKNLKRFGYPELRECAKMMALYHKIIEESGLDNKTSYSDFARIEVLAEIKTFQKKIGKTPNDRKDKIFLEASTKLVPLLYNLPVAGYSKLRKYPLHRDINPENTLWKRKKLVGIIDFENVGEIKEPFIKDIVVMLQYSCRDKKHRYKLNLHMVKLFLKEYKKYRPLSDIEIEFIPEIIVAGAVEDFSYSYWMLLNDPQRAKISKLSLYSNMAQWYAKHKQEVLGKIR